MNEQEGDTQEIGSDTLGYMKEQEANYQLDAEEQTSQYQIVIIPEDENKSITVSGNCKGQCAKFMAQGIASGCTLDEGHNTGQQCICDERINQEFDSTPQDDTPGDDGDDCGNNGRSRIQERHLDTRGFLGNNAQAEQTIRTTEEDDDQPGGRKDGRGHSIDDIQNDDDAHDGKPWGKNDPDVCGDNGDNTACMTDCGLPGGQIELETITTVTAHEGRDDVASAVDSNADTISQRQSELLTNTRDYGDKPGCKNTSGWESDNTVETVGDDHHTRGEYTENATQQADTSTENVIDSVVEQDWGDIYDEHELEGIDDPRLHEGDSGETEQSRQTGDADNIGTNRHHTHLIIETDIGDNTAVEAQTLGAEIELGQVTSDPALTTGDAAMGLS